MIEPVSVCQYESWKGSPKTFSDQMTASGLRGSPTLTRWRRLDRSNCLTISSPAFISERIAVGAEYHTVIRYFSMKRYQASAENPASSTHCVTPSAHGAMMPYEVPVTQPGSAVHQYRSSSLISSTHVSVRYWEISEY